jgi:hypothetical protein
MQSNSDYCFINIWNLSLGPKSCIFGLETEIIIYLLVVPILFVGLVLSSLRSFLLISVYMMTKQTEFIAYLLVRDSIQMFLHQNQRWVRIWVFFHEGFNKSSPERWVKLSLHDKSTTHSFLTRLWIHVMLLQITRCLHSCNGGRIYHK